MRFVPYLNFDGRCADAMRFYERVLGGTIEMLMTHGESPIAGEVPPEWHGAVMHACLSLPGGQQLMASDSPPGQHVAPQGLYVSVHVESTAEAERIFTALAEGGRTTMPLAETFWSPRFGMCVDRYGTPWMVNCASAAAAAAVGA